jgi:antitoxin (DNA-binding transcriptional repressor) of toxin-antitoxin stability system
MTDERAAPRAWRIDVSRLPEDVVELIDALGPGEDLVITRDGDPIAAISSTRDALDGAIIEAGSPDEAAGQPLMDYDNVTVVATAMKLSASARTALSAELGADYIVLDLHAAPVTADVLLAPPASPQLIGSLRSMFPKARVIIAEIDDDVLGVSYHGPVRRMLDAGAETYLTSTTIPRLAKQLDHTITRRHQITGGTSGRIEIEPSQDRGLSE